MISEAYAELLEGAEQQGGAFEPYPAPEDHIYFRPSPDPHDLDGVQIITFDKSGGFIVNDNGMAHWQGSSVDDLIGILDLLW